ncbi:TatD family hydrolase, partial [Pseudomonas sp. AH2 (2023)]|uniref:TatD family hydrolase n=1 Tax=Pseudomonas sp. AH2 (2023) TaxID=3048599 RepID=UPI002B23B3E6
ADRKELEIFNLRWQDLQSVENRGKHPYFSAGIHPQDSLRIIDFASLLPEPGCLAVGECGLDKIIDLPLPDQLHAFEAQINLSEQYELPLVLH